MMAKKQPETSTLDQAAIAATVQTKLDLGKRYWKPLHDRQDYWLNMYLLLDLMQQSKPLGFRKFISNDPRVAIDKAVSVLTTNDAYWRIDTPAGQIQKAEREAIGKIERALVGIIDDVDEQFLLRGEIRLWKQVAWFALMRGWIWGKFHITRKAIEMGWPSPLLSEMYDPRQVYPVFDGFGLADFIAERQTSFADLRNYYPEIAASDDLKNLDDNATCVKVEYWSNDRPGRKGISGTMVSVSSDDATLPVQHVKSAWLIPPYEHGFTPEQLPVIGVPANGIPIRMKPPTIARVDQSIRMRASQLGLNAPTWNDPSGWVAESGRGLLSSVEENLPQYNELVATALQHFSLGSYPTWVFHTTTGELPKFKEGLNAKIPLRIGESAERLEPRPIDSDAWRLLEILKDERQRGTLADIIQSASGFSGTGILFQQVIAAARNGLEPYGSAMTDFGRMAGSHILAQLQATKDLPTMSLVVRSRRSYFRIEFDPKVDLEARKYKPVPVFKPALPEDLLIKAQIARILLDPRRPIMSLVTVLDQVFQLEDPEGEIWRMFEDIANLDPVFVLEHVAQALERAGQPEFAARIRQVEFQKAFVEAAQLKQLQGAQMATEAAQAGPGPETGAPSATGGGQPRPGQGQAGEGGSELGLLGE